VLKRFLGWLRSLRRMSSPDQLEAELEAGQMVDEKLDDRSQARQDSRHLTR
jgi:hypothetical protein